PPPIGAPIQNVEALVVDRHGEPVPIGVPGELWLGGAGLARGYLRRPELTAERFLQHDGRRLYRTGDRVRLRADGALEFLGRLDEQVKLRGFRIEPGEIESQLQSHPDVRGAAVVMRDGRLIAYVAGRPELVALREHLRARLPSYMVPARFVVVDTLPATPNGKLDKRALPTPIEDDAGYIAPRTPAEQTIAALWGELLGRERVGVHDDFFELGGHSLIATQLISRIRAALGFELPIGAIFDTPTVAGLAEAVACTRPADGRPAEAIAPAPRERYRARTAPDGALELDPALRRLLQLDGDWREK
ncbi:MAG TPA: phosphopantetheine-binding protein, partial [Solirubrobacteraceae bacterium]|nr:phosphopantetheine-binding protein [Solirubrobacteraceae bacterium]